MPLIEFLFEHWKEIVATVGLLFGIYKWQMSGACVRLTVSGDLEAYGYLAMLVQPGQTFIAFQAENIGRKPTTLTILFASYYENIWQRLFQMNEKTFVITLSGALAQTLPFELQPGGRWVGATYQAQQVDVEKMSHEGYLIIGLHHTTGTVRKRLIIP